MTPQELAQQLKARPGAERGQWEARCPAHHDRKASLSIGTGKDGSAVLTCHAGCETPEILKVLGLEWRDLWPESEPGQQNGHKLGRIVKTYDYRDETGTLLYQVTRHDPKDFRQRRPNGHGGWIWKLGDVRRVPYRLPKILANTSGELWIFEGEKDADRAAALGLNATTTAGGAESFSKTAEAMRAVAARKHVYLVPDADDAGEGYVGTASAAVRTVAASIRNLYLPRLTQRADHGEDFSDWLDEYDGTLEELRALAARPETNERDGPRQEQKTGTAEKWQPNVQSMRALMDKELPAVKWSVRELFPEGVTLLAAKAKKGKSTLMLHVGASVAGGTMALGHFETEKSDVLDIFLHIFLEENERRLQKRLKKMMPSADVPAGLHVVYEWPLLDHGGLDALDAYLEAHPAIGMVVIDTLEHVRAKRKIANGLYGDDYAAVRGLQQLAGKRQVAIVAITHLRKAPADDPFDEINASMGLLSGVDNAVVMRPAQGIMELHRRGRDYEDDTVLALKGDRDTLLWSVAGNAEEVTSSAERKTIIAALTAVVPDYMSPQDIATVAKFRDGNVRFLLSKMLADGEVIRPERGQYTIPANNANNANNANKDDMKSGGKRDKPIASDDSAADETTNSANNGTAPLWDRADASDVSDVSDVSESAQNGHNGRLHEWQSRLNELKAQGTPEREALAQAVAESNAKWGK